MEDIGAIIFFLFSMAMQFLSCAGMIGGVLVLAGIISHSRYQKEEKKKDAWKELAQTHGLAFIPGKWQFIGAKWASVQGQYRHCSVSLETFQRGQGKSSYTCTRVRAWTDQPPGEGISVSEFALGQPLSVEALLQLLSSEPELAAIRGEIQVLNKGQNLIYQQAGLETNKLYLQQILDLLAELTTTYPRVLALGGDAVLALQRVAADDQSGVLQPVARQLLVDIGEHTEQWSKGYDLSNLFCPRCLTQCAAHELSLSWFRTVIFHGCRTCRQSREFLAGPLVAVLDSQSENDWTELPDGLYANWLRRRALFDFSRVEILQASDEDVERFAVQVGNDTDVWRKPHYGQMSCRVSSQCPLSENSMRILEQIFGEVSTMVMGEWRSRAVGN